MKNFSFKAEVWLWPGIGGWHFVNVPDEISKEVRERSGKGMVKVSCQVNKTKWDTALFPHKNQKGDFGYLISIKKIVRGREGVFSGDKIEVSFKLS